MGKPSIVEIQHHNGTHTHFTQYWYDKVLLEAKSGLRDKNSKNFIFQSISQTQSIIE